MRADFERTIGRVLRRYHAGDRHLAWNDPRIATAPDSIRLTSPAFADGGAIPERYAGTGVGLNLSPPLRWANLPARAAELALIVQDPDAPLPRPVVHLVAMALPADGTGVPEGALAPAGGCAFRFGTGSFGRIGYAGPRPVRGHGRHRYVFQIFAVERALAVPVSPTIEDLVTEIRDTVLARGRLIGVFERR